MGRNRRAFRLITALAVLTALLMLSVGAVAAPPGSTQPTDEVPVLNPFPAVGPTPPDTTSTLGSVHQFAGVTTTGIIDRFRDSNAAYQKVILPDERTRVSPTTSFPASAISLVVAVNADETVALGCSGAFIGPQVVLTAAHCLYNPEIGGWADRIVVAPGIDGDVMPFGSADVAEAWVPSSWQSRLDENWDWGLLKLSSPVGNTVGWFQIGVLSTETLSGPHFQPVIEGYPGDKPFGTQWAGQKESFLRVDDHTLYTDIDVYFGQSGSAVWRHQDGMVVGVLVRETATRNEASRITSQFLNNLLDGCGEMRCTFAYTIEPSPTPSPPPEPAGSHPVFDSMTPAPFTTVAPGAVHIAATAHSDSLIKEMRLSVNGQEFVSATVGSISADVPLDQGTYTVMATAIDIKGGTFAAAWDFTVSSNSADSEWFFANGQPNANQINATMRSLVEAFRWHLFGQSWDGSDHPDLPTHAAQISTGSPTGNWVTGSAFDQASTNATLRSLVEAFRWHFWGISWDSSAHCDVPTHVADCTSPQPPQGIDPWFSGDGQPIPANITATLRSLVEAFRWHFWGFTWDGADHAAAMPTHGG